MGVLAARLSRRCPRALDRLVGRACGCDADGHGRTTNLCRSWLDGARPCDRIADELVASDPALDIRPLRDSPLWALLNPECAWPAIDVALHSDAHGAIARDVGDAEHKTDPHTLRYRITLDLQARERGSDELLALRSRTDIGALIRIVATARRAENVREWSIHTLAALCAFECAVAFVSATPAFTRSHAALYKALHTGVWSRMRCAGVEFEIGARAFDEAVAIAKAGREAPALSPVQVYGALTPLIRDSLGQSVALVEQMPRDVTPAEYWRSRAALAVFARPYTNAHLPDWLERSIGGSPLRFSTLCMARGDGAAPPPSRHGGQAPGRPAPIEAGSGGRSAGALRATL